jgi:hypothetical protein
MRLPGRATLAACVLAVTVGAIGVAVWAAATGKPDRFRGYRFAPIILVLALFVDFFVISANRPPELPPAQQLENTLRVFSASIAERSIGPHVPEDPNVVGPLVEGLGRPPYLVQGRRPEHYALQLRRDCDGPIREAPGATVGAVLYCVSADRKTAWITVQALPAGQTFGSPQVFSVGGQAVVWTAEAVPDEALAPAVEPGGEPGVEPDSSSTP